MANSHACRHHVGRPHLRRQGGGDVLAVQLHLGEVPGQRVLVERQGPVLVHVRQGPDLVQGVGRQLALHHLRLGLLAGDLPLGVRADRHELCPVVLDIGRHQPLGLVHRGLRGAPDLDHREGRGHGADDADSALHLLRLLGQQLEEPGEVHAEHAVQELHLLLVDIRELRKVPVRELLLHGLRLREVAEGQLLLLRKLLVDGREVRDELALGAVLAEHRRHLLLEVLEEEGVHLGHPGALDEVVELPHGRAPRQERQVRVEVVLLGLEEPALLVVGQGLVPEGADVDARDLGRVHDLAQRPHHGAVDAHELRRRDPVRLVEDDVDLGVVALHGEDDAAELVGDVHLGDVEEQEDHVHVEGEPPHDLLELVAPLQPLLLARKDAGRVDEGDALDHRARQLGTFELVEEAVAEVPQLREGQRLVRDDGVAGDDLVAGPVDHGHELVGRGLGADEEPRVVAAQEVPDEGALAGRVLAYEEDHGPVGEVRVRELRRVEGVEVAVLLEGQQLLPVDPLQAVGDVDERLLSCLHLLLLS
mmetsp:Transcript_32280/g.102599  ORF Transcript_32280/g.102599 Transcript_32280/m.102599 type:complete len:533 (-) Transcript_32280:102-1700(-)